MQRHSTSANRAKPVQQTANFERSFYADDDVPQLLKGFEEASLQAIRLRDDGETGERCRIPSPQLASGTPAGMGNTAGSKRQSSREGLESGGLDTIEGSVYGAWDRAMWDDLVPILDEKVAEFYRTGKAQHVEIPGYGRCQVLPGVNKGSKRGGRGIRCRWLLKCNGIKFAIVNRREYHEKRANVLIEVGSVACMEMGHRGAVDRAKAILNALGFEWVRGCPSRVDPCADLAGVAMREFAQRFHDGFFVRLARKWAMYGDGKAGNVQTLTIGKGSIVVRMYDKLAELMGEGKDGANLRKLEYLVENRWGSEPKQATRVEFQVRRQALREQFGIDTFDDLWEKLPAMLEWLTSEWMRVCDAAPDRKNHNVARAEAGALWGQVVRAFAAWTGAKTSELVKPKQRLVKAENLEKQLVGVLAKLMALRQLLPGTRSEAELMVRDLAKRFVGELPERIWHKVIDIEAAQPEAGYWLPHGAPF